MQIGRGRKLNPIVGLRMRQSLNTAKLEKKVLETEARLRYLENGMRGLGSMPVLDRVFYDLRGTQVTKAQKLILTDEVTKLLIVSAQCNSTACLPADGLEIHWGWIFNDSHLFVKYEGKKGSGLCGTVIMTFAMSVELIAEHGFTFEDVSFIHPDFL